MSTRPTSSGSTGGASLVRLGIRVRREQAEIALAALLPILRDGAEETEPDQDEVEYAVYAPRAGLPSLEDVRALAGDALIDVVLTDVPPGWERRPHQYLQPVEVVAGTRRVRIRMPSHPPTPAATEDGAPERLIASGVPAARAGEVADAFARHGLVEAERRVQGEWAAVLLEAG